MKIRVVILDSLRLGAGFILCLYLFVGTAFAIQIDDLVVIAANDTVSSVDIPMGQGEQQPSLLPEDSEIAEGNIFGLQGGYFHPYINVQGEWTDNLYNTNSDYIAHVSNFLTRVSPGIWFSLPRKKQIPVAWAPHNTSPGGLQYDLAQNAYNDRFMTYFLIGADLKFYSEEEDLNDIDWVAEGLAYYSLPAGLTLSVLDRYTVSEDIFGPETIGRKPIRSRFNTNLLKLSADWNITEKLRLKGDYTNFLLAYEEEIDEFQNRVDNGLDLYGYFNFSEKTSIFLQYGYLGASYDEFYERDSVQDFYYVGIKWDTTEKVAMMVKAGQQERDFDNVGYTDNSGLAFDFQLAYQYSAKTGLSLNLYHKDEESDIESASDRVVFGAVFYYNQQFSEKFTGTFSFRYEDADYTELNMPEMDEQVYHIRPALQYLIQKWLRVEIAYRYDQLDSTIEEHEYKTNTFIVGLNLAK